MNRPTGKNFYPPSKTEEVAEMRSLLLKKEEDYKLLLDKYDRLFISNFEFIQARTRSPRTSRLPDKESSRGSCKSCSTRGTSRRSEPLRTRKGCS